MAVSDAAGASVQDFSPRWVALIFARNIALLVLFVGFWHLRFYVQKAQGTQYKYSPRWLSSANPSFLFRNQLWDNVFLSICSGAAIWTVYEAVALWLHANNLIAPVTWQSRPVYFTALLLITPLWLSSHFYVTHRLLHWRPLYKYIHSTHHRNVNFGPWSGLAMHPLEHVVYFSGVALFWIVPSHPIHSLFPLFHLALAASLGHNGFDRVALTRNSTFNIGHYMHFLHHKYVTVNFGNETVPLDKWFGTLYDGTAQTKDALRSRQRPSQARP